MRVTISQIRFKEGVILSSIYSVIINNVAESMKLIILINKKQNLFICTLKLIIAIRYVNCDQRFLILVRWDLYYGS